MRISYSAPAVVYRMSDREGRVLYIGCTTDLYHRLQAHKGNKPWFGDIWQLDVEPYPTRSAAGIAEREAIAAANPIYNYQHTPKANAPRPYLYGKRSFPSSRFRLVELILERFHEVTFREWLTSRVAAGVRYEQIAKELRALDPDLLSIAPLTLRGWFSELERRAS